MCARYVTMRSCSVLQSVMVVVVVYREDGWARATHLGTGALNARLGSGKRGEEAARSMQPAASSSGRPPIFQKPSTGCPAAGRAERLLPTRLDDIVMRMMDD